MKMPEGQPKPPTDSLTIEIINELETNGIDPDTYTLYEYFDPDALEELVTSADASLEVRVTIQGVQLGITKHGVHVLD